MIYRQFPIAGAITVALLLSGTGRAVACPFCEGPTLTLTEQIDQSDAVVLVEWAGGQKGTDDDPGTTVYKIVDVMKDPSGTLKKDGEISLIRHRVGQQGDLVVLQGTLTTRIEWGSPLDITRAGYEYLKHAPAPKEPTQERLRYYIKYLEFPDEIVASDAYGEFANAPYEDILALKDDFPRERLRQWLVSQDVPPTRLGLYGLMLGLCGGEDDAILMRGRITEETDEYRLGMDGVMGGYLVLTGEEGLDVIDQTKLENKDAPFSETYAAMQALRFMWTYGGGRIRPERLQQSMRGLLDRPELADLVIADLARWKDWSVQDRLMEMYGAEGYDVATIKRAIVRYTIAATRDKPKVEEGSEGTVSTPPHAAKAETLLAELREQDPQTVRQAERFYFPR